MMVWTDAGLADVSVEAWIGGQFAHHGMGRLVDGLRELAGDHAALSCSSQHCGDCFAVVWDPLQAGVGEYHVEIVGQLVEGGRVVYGEVDVWVFGARRFDHRFGRIDAEDCGVRIAFAQQCGAVARSATDVEDLVHRGVF